MLANGNPGLMEVINGNGIGVADDDIPGALARLRADFAAFKAALPGFLSRHDWPEQAGRLHSLYQDLLS